MRVSHTLLTTIILFSLILVAACDTAGPADGGESGTITVFIKDAPFPFELVDSAVVTVNSVELIGDDTTDNFLLLTDIAQSFNLLELQGGIMDTLASVPIPHGVYTGLRVVVDDDAYVKLKDGRSFALKTPSGTTSGIKVHFPEIEIADLTDEVEVVVDVDMDKSFVLQGNANTPAGIKGFLFKPVLKVESLELNDVELVTSG